MSDADCNDNDPTTEDTCSGKGCEATCSAEEVTDCIDGDEICPSACHGYTDGDCQIYGLGKTAIIDENTETIRVIKRPEYNDRKMLIRDLFRAGFPVVPFRTCIQRKVFEIIGLFDENLQIG